MIDFLFNFTLHFLTVMFGIPSSYIEDVVLGYGYLEFCYVFQRNGYIL